MKVFNLIQTKVLGIFLLSIFLGTEGAFALVSCPMQIRQHNESYSIYISAETSDIAKAEIYVTEWPSYRTLEIPPEKLIQTYNVFSKEESDILVYKDIKTEGNRFEFQIEHTPDKDNGYYRAYVKFCGEIYTITCWQ